MITKLDWCVIINNKSYQINFTVKDLKTSNLDGPIQISRMYGLDRNGIAYIISILTDGTYRLYSKYPKNVYEKGDLFCLKFIPNMVHNKTIH